MCQSGWHLGSGSGKGSGFALITWGEGRQREGERSGSSLGLLAWRLISCCLRVRLRWSVSPPLAGVTSVPRGGKAGHEAPPWGTLHLRYKQAQPQSWCWWIFVNSGQPLSDTSLLRLATFFPEAMWVLLTAPYVKLDTQPCHSLSWCPWGKSLDSLSFGFPTGFLNENEFSELY